MKKYQTHLGIVKSIESFIENNDVGKEDALIIADMLKQRILEGDNAAS